MKVKFTVPTSKEQITISQYQELERVRELNKDSDDGAFLIEKMVSIFCDVDMKDLRHIQYDHYERVVDELNKAFEQKPKHKQIIEIDGQKFGMIPNFDKMSFGEYVDLDEYVKSAADHHKFMAVLYRPITSTVKDAYSIEPYEGSEKYASIMKYASVADLEGALVFFWTLASELLETTRAYLQEVSMKTSTATEQTSDASMDGISPSSLWRVMTLLESAKSLSSTYMSAFTSSNLIKSVWTSNKEKLKQQETGSDEAVL